MKNASNSPSIDLISLRFGALIETSGRLRHPREIMGLASAKFLEMERRLVSQWREYFATKQQDFNRLAPALSHLSPKNVLARGYALIATSEGHIVTSESQLKDGDRVRLEFQDGAKGAIIADERQ